MNDFTSTRDRILEASRKLFNEKGYATTTLSEIAASIGIAQGNLTYHFSTKSELALEIEKQVRARVRSHRAIFQSGNVTDDYVELLLSSMNDTWENRFLLRDHAQFSSRSNPLRRDRDMEADLKILHELLCKMKKEGMFRRDLQIDLNSLSRSLWIVSRYWMDHLRELEALEKVTWTDQKRGLQQHLTVLMPCLTATARRELESAVLRAASKEALEAQSHLYE